MSGLVFVKSGKCTVSFRDISLGDAFFNVTAIVFLISAFSAIECGDKVGWRVFE